MKTEYQTIFHSRVANDWKPGNFVARIMVEPNRVREINKEFVNTGILVVPPRKKKFAKNNICIL